MADQPIKRFLDLLYASPELLDEVKQFNCKQSCEHCGLCVAMAQRNGIAISTPEMDAARRRFIAGELVLDGMRYAPNPERVAALKRALGQRLRLLQLVPPPLRSRGRRS